MRKRDHLQISVGVMWRLGLLASLLWAVVGALDGSTLREIFGVPLLIGAWIAAVYAVDRFVMGRVRQRPYGAR
jgi:hypothetical protein